MISNAIIIGNLRLRIGYPPMGDDLKSYQN
jgi:hypothetical protein